MRVPLSWLREFVNISQTPETLASRLTFAGLEVERIDYIGLAPPSGTVADHRAEGFAWGSSTVVIAEVLTAHPHPNADRLTVLHLNDGSGVDQVAVTDAPNILSLGRQTAAPGLSKVVYAREGAVLRDPRKTEGETVTVRQAVVRGVKSHGVICSERELGISEDHEGIILLDSDAQVGTAAADYLGDVVLDLKINPNMAHNASVLGIARELAALTRASLIPPNLSVDAIGPKLDGRVAIKIEVPNLNSRFIAGLVQDVRVFTSPYRVQHRLRLVGTRPINNVIDTMNYVMFEIGQPLHAYDWDVLLSRANQHPPKLITRLAQPNETLLTLDGVERRLDDLSVLVCDEWGPLSIAGLLGGAECGVSSQTKNVLIEAASWDPVSIRRTARAQNLASEASYRFSRGVHPAMAERGLFRALNLTRQWSGGTIAQGFVQEYPRRPNVVKVELPMSRLIRILGVRVPREEIVRILESLEFRCEVEVKGSLQPEDAAITVFRITVPDHRMDIGHGVVGQADVIEEIGRIYGYDRVPETPLGETIRGTLHPAEIEREDKVRDILTSLTLQETISYSLTSIERESWLHTSTGEKGVSDRYVVLANPISVDRTVMRRTLLPGLLETVASNLHHAVRIALFEIGPVYLPQAQAELPEESTRLGLVLAGLRNLPTWQDSVRESMDFFDLKGVIEELFAALHLVDVSYCPVEHGPFLPGRTAEVMYRGRPIGRLGQVHPLVHEKFGIPNDVAVLAAELELDELLVSLVNRHQSQPIPSFPPIKEDLAVVVAENIPASHVQDVIKDAGGSLLVDISLFDLYRGAQIRSPNKKSLAFRLTYQSPDRTLTDAEITRIRKAIIAALKRELDADLRGLET